MCPVIELVYETMHTPSLHSIEPADKQYKNICTEMFRYFDVQPGIQCSKPAPIVVILLNSISPQAIGLSSSFNGPLNVKLLSNKNATLAVADTSDSTSYPITESTWTKL